MRKSKTLSVAATLLLFVLSVFTGPANADPAEPTFVCNSVTFPAADDSSFRLNLPFTLKLGNTEYSDVYTSTNGLISFGVADTTYWDYPSSTSISLAGYDWVTWGNGAYMRYGTTANTLCIEWAVRPYPQTSGPVTYITFHAVRYPSGFWTGEITVEGTSVPANIRRGIRYLPGEAVVSIDSTFQVGTQGVPVETKTCWDGSVIPTTQDCPAEPAPQLMQRLVQCTAVDPYINVTVNYQAPQRYNLFWDNHTEDIDTVAQACANGAPTFTPPPPTVQVRDAVCRGTNTDGNDATWTTPVHYYLYWDGRTEDIDNPTAACNASDPGLDNVDAIVVLDNGVELTVTVAQALQLFESPSDLLNAVFTNPGQVITAINNIGADLTPAQRKQAQRAIVPAVVVTQVVTTTTSVTLIKAVR